LNVASVYPLPNVAGNSNNYVSTVNRTVTDDAMTARVDHKVTDKTRFSCATRSATTTWMPRRVGQTAALPTPAEAAKNFDLGRLSGIQNTT